MSTQKAHIKAFIVQALACFDTPSQVVESVKSEFGIDVTRQYVESHDPTKAAGKSLGAKWVELFEQARKRFQDEITDIPIANRAYRLRVLDRMAVKAEKMRNMALAAQLIEQAAKETGGSYTNRHQHELSGPGGGPVETVDLSKLSDKALAELMAARPAKG